MKRLAVLVLVLLGMVAGWLLRDVADNTEIFSRKEGHGSRQPAVVPLPPSAVLAVRPRGAQASAPAQRRISPAFQEHIVAKNYAAEFARLAANPARSPEEQWIYARTLEYCGRVVDSEVKTARTDVPMPNEDQARELFVKTLSDDDPERDKRIAAYDAIPRHRCDGVDATPIPRKAWRELMQVAASAGEPKAAIDLIGDEINAKFRARITSNDAKLPALSDAQLEGVKLAIASGDPYAIQNAASIIGMNYANGSLRDGQGRAVDYGAFSLAAELMACDAGFPCGEGSPSWAMDCAFSGQCGASNVRDQTMYYKASPYNSQMIALYEQALHAAAAGDWSGFRFDPKPATYPSTIR